MRKYRYILFDADDTVFDFRECERLAFIASLKAFGVENGEEIHPIYHDINDALWKKLELGLVTRDIIKTERFAELIRVTGVLEESRTKDLAHEYMEQLACQNILYPYSLDTCAKLAEKYDLYFITNGLTYTQNKRLFPSPVIKYFKKVYISEEMGCAKPSREFFDIVIGDIGDTDLSDYLVVGDSLTSDIKGAVNYGIDSCYVARGRDTENCPATYTVDTIADLVPMLG